VGVVAVVGVVVVVAVNGRLTVPWTTTCVLNAVILWV